MNRIASTLGLILWGFAAPASFAQTPAVLTLADCAITETAVTTGPCRTVDLDRRLQLNDIQTLGAHNSSHIAPTAEERVAFAALFDPVAIAGYDYTFPSLTDQLDMGVRNFEIDVQYDPDRVRPDAPPPGADGDYRVFHSAVDWRSNCITLAACLGELAEWSRAHPTHVPLVIYVQLKPPGTDPQVWAEQADYRPTRPFGQDQIRDIETLVVQTFGNERLFTPDELRKDANSLREAAQAGQWPTLGEMRGRVVVVLHQDANSPYSAEPDPVVRYRRLNPSFVGRTMFVITDDDLAPDAAFVNARGPEPLSDRIRSLVSQGFIVRRRTDDGLEEGRTGDGRRRDAAITAGAQMLATDFLQPDPTTGYVVRLGSPARCAPTRPVCREPAERPVP